MTKKSGLNLAKNWTVLFLISSHCQYLSYPSLNDSKVKQAGLAAKYSFLYFPFKLSLIAVICLRAKLLPVKKTVAFPGPSYEQKKAAPLVGFLLLTSEFAKKTN